MSTLNALIAGLVNNLRLAPHKDLTAMLTAVDSAIDGSSGSTIATVDANQVDRMLVNGANSRLGIARFTFDAGVEANRPIGAHSVTVTLPANSVIVGGFIDVNTVFTSAGGDAGTIAIHYEAGDDIVAAAAVSGAPYSSIGIKAIKPKAATPESTGIKCTTSKPITCTVAGQALLTGKLTGFLYYTVSVASA